MLVNSKMKIAIFLAGKTQDQLLESPAQEAGTCTTQKRFHAEPSLGKLKAHTPSLLSSKISESPL